MALPPYNDTYKAYAPVIARLILAYAFLNAAYLKIPGTAGLKMEIGMSAAAGLPFASILVPLAFILEAVAGFSFLLGYKVRPIAMILVPYILLINFVFFRDFSNQLNLGFFISNLSLIAGLLYVSVYGAQTMAVAKDKA